MITITKVNEVYVRVTSEPAIEQELAEYFTFEVPGAKFMPSVRNRYWDGKIRLYSTQKKLLYIGLLGYVAKWAAEREIRVENRFKLPNITTDLSFIDQLNLPLEPRDYQINAVQSCIEATRSLILSPTASGKSLIIYLLTQHYEGKKLIIVPTTSLVHQMSTDFADYGYDRPIHKIMSGQERAANEDIVVSTWQSIYKMPAEFFNQFEVIIGDEAHLFKAKSLTTIMTKATDVKYRFGFTGTLDGTQTNRLVLEGLFGPVDKTITTAELIENKQLAELTVKCLVMRYPQELAKIVNQMSYQDEITFLISNTKRNKYIKDLAIQLTGNTLILYDRVDNHGKILYDLISDAVKGTVNIDRKVFFVHGGVDAKTREDIRAITEQQEDAIIVASYGTFSTGINIRNLHNIVFASPSKSRIRVLQSIGRGLRLSDTKTKSTLYDISDDLSYNDKPNHTLKHFVERMKYYTQENFNYKIFKLNLKD